MAGSTDWDGNGVGRVDRPGTEDRESGRIVLADTSSLTLGELHIEPSLRRVGHADGREEIVEPRVMQVLVALIRAEGRILSRDELLVRCWHGVVVGDDAINRVIGRLRRLADGIGDGAFKLETITKVGFRLVQNSRDVDTRILPTASAGPATVPLLAVLAFDNLCEDPDMAWFSDGVSEEIQQTIARGTGLRVIGRASSFQFRGPEKAAGRVAAALNATHVLDGSVRRSGSKVRISAELTECAGQTSIWSDRFDRELVDIFALQDNIAGAVASALKAAFAPSISTRRIAPEVYDLYLKARASFSGDGAVEIDLLDRVTELAPSFAPAWALLAYIRATKGRNDSPTGISADDRRLIVEGATMALRLDPRAGLALATLGVIEPYARYANRERYLREALSCAPNDASLMAAMSGFCASTGRLEEAFDWATKAYLIDALDLGAAHWYPNHMFELGDRERSMRLFEQAAAHWPAAEMFVAIPLQLCAFNGMWEAFDTLAARATAKGAPTRNIRDALFVGAALRDPQPEVRAQVLGGLKNELAKSGSVSLGPVVFAYKLGLRREVFELLASASFAHLLDPESRSPGGWYNASILFAGITDMSRDRRFVGLCGKLGLCDYWAISDRWPDCAGADGLDFDFKAEARRLAKTSDS